MMPAEFTQAQKSEQAGSAIGTAALDQVLNANDQSESVLAIQNAILDLFEPCLSGSLSKLSKLPV